MEQFDGDLDLSLTLSCPSFPSLTPSPIPQYWWAKEMKDWSTLPADTIEAISSRVPNDADYVCFRSVCTSWRSAAPKRPQLPWLVVEYQKEFKPAFGLCNFPKTEILNPLLPEGIARGKRLCGSSCGWIVLLDENSGNFVFLVNPFTGIHVPLPRLGGCRHPVGRPGQCLVKAILSSDPERAPYDCVVMALCNEGKSLIHCCPKDSSWTLLSTSSDKLIFQDIIFYEGRFYAVSKFRLFVCDIRPHVARVTEILPADQLFSDCQTRWSRTIYLVVSFGDLLLAAVTDRSWEVFRVDLDCGHMKLLKVENLGNRALFLGRRSLSLSAGNSALCKGNCIYYFQPTFATSRVMGFSITDTILVFSMEDGSTSSITSIPDNTCSQYWGTHWLTPNLC